MCVREILFSETNRPAFLCAQICASWDTVSPFEQEMISLSSFIPITSLSWKEKWTNQFVSSVLGMGSWTLFKALLTRVEWKTKCLSPSSVTYLLYNEECVTYCHRTSIYSSMQWRWHLPKIKPSTCVRNWDNTESALKAAKCCKNVVKCKVRIIHAANLWGSRRRGA